MSGTLYVVGTPIGNLSDITPRALDTLRLVDAIACENPSRHLKLLNHYGIKKRLFEYGPANEKNSAAGLLKLLQEGKNLALVSDAGCPNVSDPGYALLNLAAGAGISIVPIPGVSALTTLGSIDPAMSAGFVFLGFLPKSVTRAVKAITAARALELPVVIYISQYQIKKFLEAVNKNLGNVEIFIGREMTKMNEEYIRGRVSDLLALDFKDKGEFTVRIDPGSGEGPEK